MRALSKGLIVALLHVLIVLSLGGKLLYDRAHRPRIWVRTRPDSPVLPMSGRYLMLSLKVRAPELKLKPGINGTLYGYETVELSIENGSLVAHATDKQSGMYVAEWQGRPGIPDHDLPSLGPPIAFFVPRHTLAPRLNSGEEIWAEVTIPKKGPPRPIQLALKRGTEWIPITYR